MLSFLTRRESASVHFCVKDHAFVALKHRVVARAIEMIEAENDVAKARQFLHDDGIHTSVSAKTVAEEDRSHLLFAVSEDVRQLDAHLGLGLDFSPRPEKKRASLRFVFVPGYGFTELFNPSIIFVMIQPFFPLSSRLFI